jgi:hypothetical protein
MLGQPKDDPQVIQTYKLALKDPQIQTLIHELTEWPGPILKSHKKAGHFLHKLGFLAEIGFGVDDPGIAEIIQRVFDHISPEGLFQVKVNINPRYGGSGEDQYAWMLCDAPLVTYAMVKFGLGDSPEVQAALEYLLDLQRENGWPCRVSPELGKFRGPGRKDDPCPYANLVMTKLLSQFPDYHSHLAVERGVESLLTLWEQRRERRPYLFAMGTDFTKLKAPLVWYDIIHITDVLSEIPWVLGDGRFQEMVGIVRDKADQDGRFTAESIWMDWRGWDFGQKKEPSRWLTLVAQRMLKRVF